MGFGGVTALGCTIGQGLTGVSTLAVGPDALVAVDVDADPLPAADGNLKAVPA